MAYKAYGRQKDYPCMKCTKHVKKNDYAVPCRLCELWLHKTCPGKDKEESEMSDELFKALDLQKTLTGGAFWVCNSCQAFSVRYEKRVLMMMRLNLLLAVIQRDTWCLALRRG